MNGHGDAECSHAAVLALLCVSAPKTKDAGVNCSSLLIRVNYIYTVTAFFDVFLEIPLVVRNNSKTSQRTPHGLLQVHLFFSSLHLFTLSKQISFLHGYLLYHFSK